MVLLLGLVTPSCLAWGHCGRRLGPPSFLHVVSASDIFGLQENCALGTFTYSEVLALWLEERQTDLPWRSLHCTSVASLSASGSMRWPKGCVKIARKQPVSCAAPCRARLSPLHHISRADPFSAPLITKCFVLLTRCFPVSSLRAGSAVSCSLLYPSPCT